MKGIYQGEKNNGNISKKELDKMFEESYKIHHIYHGFCDWMKQLFYNLEPHLTKALKPTKRKYRHFAPEKTYAYKAMRHARKFAKNNPEILVVGCDDDYHCSSEIYLIPHESDKGYWGTTMIFIPQCTNTQNIICLYPEHVRALIKALQELDKRQGANPYDNYD